MMLKMLIRLSGSLMLFGFLLLASEHDRNIDPFAAYRNFTKAPLTIEKKSLRHFAEIEEIIRAKLKLDLSKRERSILAGLHWLITFADADKNFGFMFSDFMLLMNILADGENRVHQKEVVNLIIKKSLARAEKKLNALYKPDENSRWSFICILQALRRFPEFQDSYVKFYREHFKPASEVNNEDDLAAFSHGVKVADYKLLFDYLVGASFLHYYRVNDNSNEMALPEDKFQYYLRELENFDYIKDHLTASPQFRSLGYLVTHVVLVLTNYGELKIAKSINQQKAKDYIEASFDKVRHELGDFDLFAEYVQSIKILSYGRDRRISDLEKYIYDLQRPDGSWGSQQDFETNPYTGIHPTGAALMALNQSNLADAEE